MDPMRRDVRRPAAVVAAIAAMTAVAACPNAPPAACDAGECGSEPDAGTASDAGTADAGSADSGAADSGTADAASWDGGADASIADAGIADAGIADAGSRDGGCAGPGDKVRTLYYGGRLRTYYIHAPPGHDCSAPTPVVFDFHGYSSNAGQQILLTGMNAKADAEGFVAVHPEGWGLAESWNAGACCGDAAFLNLDDVGFVRQMLGAVGREYNVDPKRVYAAGFSNGGFLSHRLACEAADVFAAIAPVSGVMGIPTCNPSRPVPVVDFHGTGDLVVPYNGSAVLGFVSVDTTMTGWAARDGCGATRSVVYAKGDVTCEKWLGCPAAVDVVLCTVTNGAHTWPGTTVIPGTTQNIDATDYLWSFFVAHPMP